MVADSSQSIQRVSIKGVLDSTRQVRIGPRPPPKDAPEHLVPVSGNRGSLVVCPLKRADGSEILVLRGWWPSEIPTPEAPAGTVTIEGVLRPAEDVSLFVQAVA
jgi:cytochrome oxidase assembly protein ShyY1